MWLEFGGAVLFGMALLYIPGYLVGRAFRVGRLASVALAPLFSAIVLVVAGIVLERAGVTCPGAVLAGVALAACAIAWAVPALVRRSRRGKANAGAPDLLACDDAGRVLKVAVLYVAVAAVIAALVYLPALGDPNAFSRHDDSTMHLAAIRGFIDTGTYSALNVSAYLDQGLAGSFYPAGWYVPVAVVASLFGGNVVMANNAVTFAFLVVVFPLAMCLLFHRLFPESPRVRLAGSLFPLAFSGFPWGFLVFGQLLPNMMAFMFVPLVLALVVEETDTPRAGDRALLAAAVVVGLLSIAFAQPNGAFTCGIWVVLYLVGRIFYTPGASKATVTGKRVAAAVALIAAGCAVWLVAYNLPFFEAVVEHTWEAMLRPHEALAAGLLFIFTWREGVHPFLTVVALLGVVYACRNRRYLWLAVAYVAALAFYVIDMSTEGPVKQLLTGFWYTDYYRTGAMTALFAMPVCALGFCWLLELLEGVWARLRGRASERSTAVIAAVLVVVMVACQFAPYGIRYNSEVEAKSGLPKIREALSGYYSWEKGLTQDECAFVARALADLPDGALIVNVPRDGSCWLYGVEGANVFFRRSTKTGQENGKASKLLRTRLCDVATDDDVRELVDELGARYVLRLDAGSEDEATTIALRYDEDDWRGIESIDENTPGFELVMSEGDMRLYRIA